MRLKIGIFGALFFTRQWTPFPYFFQWRFDPIPCHGLRLQCFAITHNDTPHSVGLLWTSDQPDAGTSTWQHTILTRDKHPYRPPAGFEPTIAGSKLLQTHFVGRAATLFLYNGEKLVTSRGPASFPYRLWTMLLDSNGQRQGLLKRVWTYWDAGSVGEENLEFKFPKNLLFSFLQ